MQHTPGFGNALVFASRQYNSADSADCAIRPKLTITYEGSAATPPEVNYKSPLPVGILHGPDEEPIGEQAVVEDTVTVIASQDAHLKGDSANGEAPVLCFTSFYETPRTALCACALTVPVLAICASHVGTVVLLYFSEV